MEPEANLLEDDATELMAYANNGDARSQNAVRQILSMAVGGDREAHDLLVKSIGNLRSGRVKFSNRDPRGVIASLRDQAINMGKMPAPEGYMSPQERQNQPTERESKLLEIIMRQSDELEALRGQATPEAMSPNAP